MLKTSLAEKRNLVESLDSRGVPTVYAFVSKHSRLMPDARIAVLAIPRHLLFAQADRQIFRNLSWLAIAAGLALALGWLGSNLLIVRPINALVSSTFRLTGGDLTARSGLNHRHDELGQLTRAYDQMGEILEDRDREHKRARRKLQALSHKLVEAQESERKLPSGFARGRTPSRCSPSNSGCRRRGSSINFPEIFGRLFYQVLPGLRTDLWRTSMGWGQWPTEDE